MVEASVQQTNVKSNIIISPRNLTSPPFSSYNLDNSCIKMQSAAAQTDSKTEPPLFDARGSQFRGS